MDLPVVEVEVEECEGRAWVRGQLEVRREEVWQPLV